MLGKFLKIILLIALAFFSIELFLIVLLLLIIRLKRKSPDVFNERVNTIKKTVSNTFNKNTCIICEKRLRLNNGRELKGGTLCSECSAIISPWFNDDANTSILQVIAQLKGQVIKRQREFVTSRILYAVKEIDPKVIIDDASGSFIIEVENQSRPNEIIDFSEVDRCRLEIVKGHHYTSQVSEADLDEARGAFTRGEIDQEYHQDVVEASKAYVHRNGKVVLNDNSLKRSFAKDYYNFYIIIDLNHGFYDQIKFKLNTGKVYSNSHDYEDYQIAGRSICNALLGE